MNTHYIFDLVVRQTIQLTVLIVVVGAVTKLLCRRRPHLAHVLWLLVLIKAVTPPIWSSPTSVFSWAGIQRHDQPPPAAVAVTIPKTIQKLAGNETTAPVPSALSFVPIPPQKPLLAQASPAQVANLEAVPREVAQSNTFLILRVLAMVWGIGTAGMLGVLAVRWAILRRRIAACTVPPPAGLLGTVREVCRELGGSSDVRTVLCRDTIGPAVFGFVRPTLVLPAAVWDGASRRELRHILAHEIVHVRRGDPLVSALQALVQAIWWFHPLVWWTNRKINEVREVCCDAEVISGRQCEPEGYAQMLIDVARLRRRYAMIEPALGVSGAEVTKRRLEYIMNEAGRMAARRRWIDWMLFAACALILLPGAGRVHGADTTGNSGAATAATTPPSTQASPEIDFQTQHFVDPKMEALKQRINELHSEMDRLAKEGQTSSDQQMRALDQQMKALDAQSAAYAYKNYAGLVRNNEARVRHFVMIVVGMNAITFQGQETSLDLLPARLLDVPDAPHTVVQLAYASGDVTMRRFSEVQGRVGEMVKRLEFEYLSLAGEHSPDSKGSPDEKVNNAQVMIFGPGQIAVRDGQNSISADRLEYSAPVAVPAAEPPVIATSPGFLTPPIYSPPSPPLTPAPMSQVSHVVNFQIGQSGFHPGDNITITEVRGTSDQFEVDGTYQVKGTYTLASHDSATLMLSLAAGGLNGYGGTGNWQAIKIRKGSGTFTLTERMRCQGYPHVSFYDGSSFGGVYFGTGDWISY